MNKVVIVTGGSRGIGAATSKLLASKGYAVCVNYRSRVADAESVVAQITELIEPALEGLPMALDSGEVHAVIRASQIVLDRTGFAPRSSWPANHRPHRWQPGTGDRPAE